MHFGGNKHSDHSRHQSHPGEKEGGFETEIFSFDKVAPGERLSLVFEESRNPFV